MGKLKKGGWVTAKLDDEEIKYTYERHKPISLKNTPWLYCRYCGLVYLNNDITRWSIKMGCNSAYHPSFNIMLKKSVKKRRDQAMGMQNVNIV